jgi:hypothetical protein
MKKIRKKRREKIAVREIKFPEVREKRKQEEPTKKPKESSLEEQIEESEIIEENEFREFVNLQPQNLRSAPVLEKVETKEDLEENVASTPLATPINTENANAIDYVSSNYFSSSYGTGGDNKYAESSSMSSPILERERTSDIPRQEILNWQEELQVREHSSFMEQGHRVHTRSVEGKNEMPFENKEKKYKQFRG